MLLLAAMTSLLENVFKSWFKKKSFFNKFLIKTAANTSLDYRIDDVVNWACRKKTWTNWRDVTILVNADDVTTKSTVWKSEKERWNCSVKRRENIKFFSTKQQIFFSLYSLYFSSFFRFVAFSCRFAFLSDVLLLQSRRQKLLWGFFASTPNTRRSQQIRSASPVS